MLPGLVINPSTTLVLIRNLSSVTTIVYLSTLNVPDFQVTIRDATGSANIATSSICLSTIPASVFQDGRAQVCLNQPYANVTVQLRNSTTWEVLNSFGLPPAESAANLNTLNASTVYVSFVESQQKLTSSLIVGNLTTSTNIQIGGDYIFPAFSTLGNVTFLSSLTVKGQTRFDSNLVVSGPTYFANSLSISSLSSVNAPIRVGGSVGVGKDIFVKNSLNILDSLFTASTLTMNSLQVQKSTSQLRTTGVFQGDVDVGKQITIGSNTFVNEVLQTSTLRVNGGLSSFSNVLVNGELAVGGAAFLNENLSSLSNTLFGQTSVAGSLYASSLQIKGNLVLLNFLSANSLTTNLISIGETLSSQSIYVGDTLFASTGLSSVSFVTANTLGVNRISAGTLFVGNLLSSVGQTDIGGAMNVVGKTTFQALENASTLHTGGNLSIGGDLSLFGGGFVGDTIVKGSVQSANSLVVGGNAESGGTIFVGGTLTVNGNTTFQNITANTFFLDRLNIQKQNGLTIMAPNIRASSIQASNIFVSSILTDAVSQNQGIEFTSSYSLFSQSTFSRSTNTNQANIQDWVVDGTFQVGTGVQTLGPSTDFIIYADSFFTRGFSSIRVSAPIARASSIQGAFIGDGSALLNANVLTQNISATSLSVGAGISVNTLFVSSGNISSFLIRQSGVIQSSLVFSTLSIYSFNGQPIPDGCNSITTTQDTSTLTLNKSIFINRSSQNVGVFLSAPQYTLDVSGLIACSAFFYSSINQNIITSNVSALTILTSTLIVRDSYRVIPPFASTSPILVFDSNNNLYSYTSSFFSTPGVNSLTSILDGNRAILSLNRLNIFGKENSVTIGALASSNFQVPSSRLFQVPSSVHAFSTFASSVLVTEQIVSQRLRTPLLGFFQQGLSNYIHVPPGAPTTDLYFNSNILTNKGQMGIGSLQTGITFNTTDAYFSTAQVDQLQAANIAYRFVNL